MVPRLFVERFLLQLREGALDRNEALRRCEDESSHIARVFAAAVRKWGKPAVEVEQAVLDEGERIANVLRRYLRVLNGVSTVSPLLGLLGTVWGMIQAFNVIATSPAMGRAEMLAGGISVALITTAAGLLVAIPALIFYLYFVGRVDSLVMEIDHHGQELVNLISFEALEERKTLAPSQRAKRQERRERIEFCRRLARAASPTSCRSKLQHDETPALNLTSMIDVLFLLIIFFMVATKFDELERNIEVAVPEVAQTGDDDSPPEPTVVTVQSDGTLAIGGDVVTSEQLVSRLTAARTPFARAIRSHSRRCRMRVPAYRNCTGRLSSGRYFRTGNHRPDGRDHWHDALMAAWLG